MKKMIFFLIILVFLIPKTAYADENILEEQKSDFKITNFLEETKKYTKDFEEDLKIDDVFNQALKGKIDNKILLEKILKLFGINIREMLKILIQILSIILVHSILKAFTDGLENNQIPKIVYYAQYILIVTIIMANFAKILETINNTISGLIGFTRILIPILCTLMVYTGSITTTALVEPILLLLIEIITGIIKRLILPGISIIAVLAIVSKMTDKIQIGKIEKFMKSSVIWILVVIMTAFIGVLSLEGTLTSSVDGITAKTAKAAVSNLIPIVR